MIQEAHGNLLEARVDALVNTVNTQGVMGKGIALQFKRAFPDNFAAYQKACRSGQVRMGQVFLFDRGMFERPRYIFNFPTKHHWRQKSSLEAIRIGLEDLLRQVERLEIQSLAVPPLGSGLGGLDWAQVRPLIAKAFADTPVQVLLYEPDGAPPARQMPNRTEQPPLTAARAAVLALMKRYRVPGYEYRLSLLEIQKLCYFLQEAGQPLKLEFRKMPYGPYADGLRHVLNKLEGHYISGYGDGKNDPETEIQLLPLADQADDILAVDAELRQRFNRVAALIEGFELPYGMELLATVHWVITRELQGKADDLRAVVAKVHAWTARKREQMDPKHIHIAAQRLVEANWV